MNGRKLSAVSLVDRENDASGVDECKESFLGNI